MFFNFSFWSYRMMFLKIYLKNPSMLQKNHTILQHLQTMMIADATHPPFTSQVITVMILVIIITM